MVGGTQLIESSLQKNLIEHLNAEVVLYTITDLEVAVRWLASTFLYIRARKNPRHYGLPFALTSDQLDKKLLEMCQIEINKLAKEGMLILDGHAAIAPTTRGYLMAKYYMRFESMKLFNNITGREILQQILAIISKCDEFSDMYLRVNDKKWLNMLNKAKDRETVRFPLNGRIKSVDEKINCLIQAAFGSLTITDASLTIESQKVVKIGERITSCLIEMLESRTDCFSALVSVITLGKCFRVRLWENSTYLTKQLPKIGAVHSKKLSDAGKTTYSDIINSNPRDLERILNKKAPFGNDIQDQVKHLPKYRVNLELTEENNEKIVVLNVVLLNAEDLQKHMTVDRNSFMHLIVGDDANNVLLYERYKHSYLRETQDITHTMVLRESKREEIVAHFISENWVGIDSSDKLILVDREVGTECKSVNDSKSVVQDTVISHRNAKRIISEEKIAKKTKSKEPSAVQKFMDMHFKKIKKPNNGSNKSAATKSSKKTFQRTITQVLKKKPQTISSKCSEDDQSKSIHEDGASGRVIARNVLEEIEYLLKSKESQNSSANVTSNISSSGTSNIDNNKGALDNFKYTQPNKLLHHPNGNEEPKVTQHPDSTSGNYQIKEICCPIDVCPSVNKSVKWSSPLTSYINTFRAEETNKTQGGETSKETFTAEKTLQFKPKTSCNNTQVNNIIAKGRRTGSLVMKRINSENFNSQFPITDVQCVDLTSTATSSENTTLNEEAFYDDLVSDCLWDMMGFRTKEDSRNTDKLSLDVAPSSVSTLNNSAVKVQKRCVNTTSAYLRSLGRPSKASIKADIVFEPANSRIDAPEESNQIGDTNTNHAVVNCQPNESTTTSSNILPKCDVQRRLDSSYKENANFIFQKLSQPPALPSTSAVSNDAISMNQSRFLLNSTSCNLTANPLRPPKPLMSQTTMNGVPAGASSYIPNNTNQLFTEQNENVNFETANMLQSPDIFEDEHYDEDSNLMEADQANFTLRLNSSETCDLPYGDPANIYRCSPFTRPDNRFPLETTNRRGNQMEHVFPRPTANSINMRDNVFRRGIETFQFPYDSAEYGRYYNRNVALNEFANPPIFTTNRSSFGDHTGHTFFNVGNVSDIGQMNAENQEPPRRIFFTQNQRLPVRDVYLPNLGNTDMARSRYNTYQSIPVAQKHLPPRNPFSFTSQMSPADNNPFSLRHSAFQPQLQNLHFAPHSMTITGQPNYIQCEMINQTPQNQIRPPRDAEYNMTQWNTMGGEMLRPNQIHPQWRF